MWLWSNFSAFYFPPQIYYLPTPRHSVVCHRANRLAEQCCQHGSPLHRPAPGHLRNLCLGLFSRLHCQHPRFAGWQPLPAEHVWLHLQVDTWLSVWLEAAHETVSFTWNISFSYVLSLPPNPSHWGYMERVERKQGNLNVCCYACDDWLKNQNKNAKASVGHLSDGITSVFVWQDQQIRLAELGLSKIMWSTHCSREAGFNFMW